MAPAGPYLCGLGLAFQSLVGLASLRTEHRCLMSKMQLGDTSVSKAMH